MQPWRDQILKINRRSQINFDIDRWLSAAMVIPSEFIKRGNQISNITFPAQFTDHLLQIQARWWPLYFSRPILHPVWFGPAHFNTGKYTVQAENTPDDGPLKSDPVARCKTGLLCMFSGANLRRPGIHRGIKLACYIYNGRIASPWQKQYRPSLLVSKLTGTKWASICWAWSRNTKRKCQSL